MYSISRPVLHQFCCQAKANGPVLAGAYPAQRLPTWPVLARRVLLHAGSPPIGPLDSLDSDDDDSSGSSSSWESSGASLDTATLASVDSFYNSMQAHLPGCGSHTGPLLQWREVTAQGCYALHGPARITKAGPGILRAELLPGSWLELGGTEFGGTVSMCKEVVNHTGVLHQHVCTTSNASHDFTTSFSMSEEMPELSSGPEPTCLLIGEHMEVRGEYALATGTPQTSKVPAKVMYKTADGRDGQPGSSTDDAGCSTSDVPCTGILQPGEGHDDFVMLSVHALPDTGVTVLLEEGSLLSHPVNMLPCQHA